MEGRGFRFSLGNLMLMMVPLAAMCAVVGYGISKGWNGNDVRGIVVLAGVIGVPAAMGALLAGRTGMWEGFGVGFRMMYGAMCVVTLVVFILWVVARWAR